jgi:UDP-glucuronate decarboxylase
VPDGTGRTPLAFSPPVARLLQESDLDIVVTGAGGWVGRATLEMLHSVLGASLTARVHAYGSTRRVLALANGRSLACESLSELRNLNVGPHLLLHFAFLTREHAGSRSVAEYQSLNENISDAVVAHADRSEVRGLFFPSSGAVYNGDGSLVSDIDENPYGVLKVRDERRLAQVADDPSRVAIVRVFNLAGPFINKPTLYVLGSILEDIAHGGPIRLRADRPVIRSYAHVRDVVDIAFATMLGITAGPLAPFDTAGDCVVEVGDLASIAARVLGMEGVQIERPVIDARASPDRYVGDGATMEQLAASYGLPLAGLEMQIRDTAVYLRSR